MSQDGRPPDPATRTEGEGETFDMPEGYQPFTPGQVLGERYQILEMLGRGGMGEVWHAFDLKLRVEVALKALREDFFKSERRLEMLRDEVRAAREVVSPNVCRIFDLIEIEGRELVSMEYVDGATLLGVLQERGPLELKEAQDIASQFLAGLEAIHKVGLIHRDIKPENIMLTRAGRVVVMDFGLARQDTEGGGSVSGTPAYMAPEQAAGQTVDARADVYAAGVVLAEMVSPDGIKSYESRQSVWEGVRSEPAKLPESPWAPVLKRAVAKDREGRFNTARTLTRALEDVTLRVEGAEDLHPYPGLASYTEEDAEYFFGREAEIEQMWRKLDGPPRMLALVGPSGAGKSSFLRAGLVAAKTTAWATVVCTPGSSPMRALANAFVEEFAGDTEAMRQMLDFESADSAVEMVSRWSNRHDHALLIVDQFEELFTQNMPDDQRRVANLLNRLVLEADVHVLLSMRDDFFFHCHQYDAFAPLQDGLTLIGPPVGGALRRALVRPATKCGYRFEDDALIEEMLAEVEGERGALPLLAFAAAQLWEQRDRETGHLTRQAYQEIGGVGGALARHAEGTIGRIGTERIAHVREIFRNLVTAEGTRAVREWDELLSVFASRDVSRAGINPAPTKGSETTRKTTVGEGFIPSLDAASEILHELIDARLLTSYEVREDEREPTRQVEIIHESLLANWPRLVRWQTQDADAVQLRDQLRQAARTWDERERPKDLLWAGSAYLDFMAWRERYPGGLTDTEEAFATAMTSLATRRRRRRRIAAAAAFAILLAVLVVVGVSRQQAVAAANHAIASKLVALGNVMLKPDHTEALAYAIASLDRADTVEGRRLALHALWAGPTATSLPDLPVPGSEAPIPNEISPHGLAVSPDGRFLAAGYPKGMVQVFPRDGGAPVTFQGFEEHQGTVWALHFSPDGRFLVGGSLRSSGEVRVWETENGRLVRILKPPGPPELFVNQYGYSVAYGLVEPDLSSVLTITFRPERGDKNGEREDFGHWLLRRWPLDRGPFEFVGEVEGTIGPVAFPDLSRRLLASGIGNELLLHRLDTLGREPPRVIGRNSAEFGLGSVAFDPARERLAANDMEGSVLLWSLDGDGSRPERDLGPGNAEAPFRTAFSRDGSRLAHTTDSYGWLWNLQDPTFTGPLRLGVDGTQMREVSFTPNGRWLATASTGQTQRYRLTLWPASNSYRRRPPPDIHFGFFHPDGSRVFTRVVEEDGETTLVSLPITGDAGLEPTVLFHGDVRVHGVDPKGRFLIIGTPSGIQKLPLDGTAPTIFETVGRWPSLDRTGRYLAGNPDRRDGNILLVLDLETGERTELDVPGTGPVRYAHHFDSTGRLLVTRDGVLSALDLGTGVSEVVVSKGIPVFLPIGDGSRLYIGWKGSGVRTILDLEDGSRTPMSQVHQPPSWVDFDSTGAIAISGHPSGEIRVGPLFSDEYHLLLGHDAGVPSARISGPGGSWIFSGGSGGTNYVWPMPDLSKPPFHSLPYAEFMAKLKALTNLRAVPDEKSATGYSIKADFSTLPNWAEAPEW